MTAQVAQKSDQVHHDRGQLAAPVSAKLFEGRVARVHGDGDPLRYSWGDEYRDATELQRIVDQLPGAPFTLLHPEGLISEGTPAKVVGKVISARVDGEYAVAQILVTDDEALLAIESGIHELSLGYTSHADDNGYQRNIRVDHLALVPRARCGASCSLRADNTLNTNTDCSCSNSSDGKIKAPEPEVLACPCGSVAVIVPTAKHREMDANSDQKPLLDELQKKLAEALASAAAEKARADAAETRATKAESDKTAAEVVATNAQAGIAAEKARADKAVADAEAAKAQARKDADDAFDKRVGERVELLSTAGSVGLKDESGNALNIKTMNDRDIKVAVVKHVDGLEIAADKPDAFVDGVFAGALDRHAKASESRDGVRQALQVAHKDAAATLPVNWRDAERAAQAEMIDLFSSSTSK